MFISLIVNDIKTMAKYLEFQKTIKYSTKNDSAAQNGGILPLRIKYTRLDFKC